MDLETAHEYEDELRETLKKRNPNHKALKKYYGSTWRAIEEYEKALYGDFEEKAAALTARIPC